jgi:hypothetical protein
MASIPALHGTGEGHKLFWNVAFWWPKILDLGLHAVIALISRGRLGQLKKNQRSRQPFPMQLLPKDKQDKQTCLFGKLRETCEENDLTKQKKNHWILDKM